MIVGKVPFEGEYEQAVVYSILNENPEPLTSRRTGVPMQLEWIVNKLMAKDADYRYQTAADLMADLKTVDLSGSGQSRRSMPAYSADEMDVAPVIGQKGTPRWVWPALVAASVFGGLAVWSIGGSFMPDDAPPPSKASLHFDLPFHPEESFPADSRRWFDVAPDGSSLVYEANNFVKVRRAGNLNVAENLWGMSGSLGFGNPMFSPNGEWFAFDANRLPPVLMKSRPTGEPPVHLVEMPGRISGGHWADDGFIYLGLNEFGLARVSENEGTLSYVIPPDSIEEGVEYAFPYLIAGGNKLLYTKRSDDQTWSETEIWLMDLESRESIRVLSGGTDARYLESGRIVYYRAGFLYARIFDGLNVSSLGDEVRVASDVAFSFGGVTGAAMYAVTSGGTLFSWRGTYDFSAQGSVNISWVDDEEIRDVMPDMGTYYVPRVQPGGRLLAVQDGWFGPSARLLLIDGVTGNKAEEMQGAQMPVWSSEGDKLAYGSGTNILVRQLGRFDEVDTLWQSDTRVDPTDWSADGRYLLYNREAEGMGSTSIRYLDLETGETHPYLNVDRDLDYARFSPDGEWVTYEWGRVGSSQAAIQRFPGGEDQLLVSELGGNKPLWSADGAAIYYSTKSGIIRAEIDRINLRVTSSETEYNGGLFQFQAFDVHPDDGRLLIIPSQAGGTETREGTWDVFVNWANSLPVAETGDSK